MFRGLTIAPGRPALRRICPRRAACRRVAYPFDDFGIRKALTALFRERGLNPAANRAFAKRVRMKLRGVDITEIASTPADAYRFLDAHRALFGVPYEANFSVLSVYSTNKRAKSGYRPPREHIIEFVWSEDVPLSGSRFKDLSGSTVPLHCGGTLVFDSNGNFLHLALAAPTPQRRNGLLDYVAWLVQMQRIGMAGGEVEGASIRATVENGRVQLLRVAAMRHARHPPQRKR
jgi:hypothetical protein